MCYLDLGARRPRVWASGGPSETFTEEGALGFNVFSVTWTEHPVSDSAMKFCAH